ncbi:MAG: efflux RND transporter periplasmic adaptor subunit [Chloroflexi bacterium]|nr:MAG: efflux RND transporter periplasmic adaptor subunit [Chloroflexota bacterium]
MKRCYWSVLSAIAILAASVNPVFAPHVSFRYCETCGVAAPKNNVSTQKTVTASAVIVPAQVSELGFLISGIARDIPVKEGDSVKAGQTLMVLDTPDLQFAVDAARADVRAAQAEEEIRRNEIIKKYKINYINFTVKKLRLSVPYEEIEIANARIQQARASVEIARADLAQGTLSAPHDGVIASIKVIPGEFVPSDQAVVTLATLNALQVETTDLSERDIPNVQMGDSASIFVEALNRDISGKVIGISPIASTVGGDVVFKVTIAPDTQPEGLLWGMTAEVEIKSGE